MAGTSFATHLDYTDDIYLLSRPVMHLGQMALHLKREEGKVGLQVNINKAKILSLTKVSFSLYI